MLLKWIGLAFGGIIGTFARYILSSAVQRATGIYFPFGTLCVNLLGCFIAGFFFTLADEKGLLSTNMRVFLQIGFCGAFTTFSTFILEMSTLLRDGQLAFGIANLIASLVGGIVVFILGSHLAHQL